MPDDKRLDDIEKNFKRVTGMTPAAALLLKYREAQKSQQQTECFNDDLLTPKERVAVAALKAAVENLPRSLWFRIDNEFRLEIFKRVKKSESGSYYIDGFPCQKAVKP